MADTKKTKVYTQAQAFVKIASFCAYQERTHTEVRSKLNEYGIKTDEAEELIVKLISDNFINEERFARAFAGGKFRIKKWGKNKIIHELKQKGLSSYCIRMGLSEISEEDYQLTILDIIEKKESEVTDKNLFQKKSKIGTYLISRGFEADLVWDVLNERIRETK